MEKSLKVIEEKLDLIVKLLCSKCIEGKSPTDAILTLENVGIERGLIAKLTGSSDVAIRVAVHRAKRQKIKGKGKRKGNNDNGKASS